MSAVHRLKAGEATLAELDAELPTVGAYRPRLRALATHLYGRKCAPHPPGSTFLTTAVLEAGRVSLDNGSRPVRIVYDSDAMDAHPSRVELA